MKTSRPKITRAVGPRARTSRQRWLAQRDRLILVSIQGGCSYRLVGAVLDLHPTTVQRIFEGLTLDLDGLDPRRN